MLRDTACLLRDTAYLLRDTACLLRDTASLLRDTACLLGDTACLLGDTACLLGDTACLLRDTACLHLRWGKKIKGLDKIHNYKKPKGARLSSHVQYITIRSEDLKGKKPLEGSRLKRKDIIKIIIQ